MKIASNSKLLFIGDSITDVGRAQPYGEVGDALGRGYVSLVDALLGAVYPELAIRVFNVGTSGNTVRDLKNRWQRDVLDLKPDWLSIMIGTNDVWRQFDRPRQPEIHVLPDEYRRTLNELVAQTKPSLQGLVLMTPFFIEPRESDVMRTRMDEYGRIVKEVADRHQAIFVDTQAAFNAVLGHVYSATLAGDRVHPSLTGHMILARTFLNHVGFEWNG